MKNDAITVLYLAYGPDSLKYQVVLSLLTLYHHLGADNKQASIVIYTDANHSVFTNHLKGLPVDLRTLKEEEKRDFMGTHNYFFRIKLAVIKECLNQRNENLLFLDSDTFFMRDPTKLISYIKPGHSIMNAEEYDFLDGGEIEYQSWFDMRQTLKQHSYTIKGQKVRIPLATKMWNSGVFGISKENTELIDDIIGLIDELYAKKKVFFAEQFAVSYILQINTDLRSSEDYVNHYWLKEIKNSFNTRISTFLKANANKSGQELYQAAFDFAVETSQIATVVDDPLFVKISKRLAAIMKAARKGYA